MCPIWLPVFYLIFYNEPELGAEIDPGMALTPPPSSIGQGSNPPPSDCEPSALLLDHSFRFNLSKLKPRLCLIHLLVRETILTWLLGFYLFHSKILPNILIPDDTMVKLRFVIM